MFYLSFDHIRKKSAITYKKHVRKHYNWQIMCTYTWCTSGASKKHLTPYNEIIVQSLMVFTIGGSTYMYVNTFIRKLNLKIAKKESKKSYMFR